MPQQDYLPRVVDSELDELLPGVAAIAIEGAKAVGKTATAIRRGRTIYRLDVGAQLEIAQADPERLVTGERPVLIDEWQRLPEAWDAVRRAVDADPSPGQFLLTGSATPSARPAHSGAGRIVTVRMRPMSLAERGVGRPSVSLGGLLAGSRGPISGTTDVNLELYAQEIVASGFPGIRPLVDRSLRSQLDGYVDRIVERDVPELGYAIRNPAAMKRWLTAYAASISTTASLESIRDAATAGENRKPAKQTTQPYRDVLERLWVLDPVPAWLPTRNRLSRLAAPPKHQLVDPALAARLLGLGVGALLDGREVAAASPRDGSFLGRLFESLVALSVRIYAQAAEARVMHLRTWAGEREVDLIIERDDQRVLAMEVKLGATVSDRDVRHLRWLRDEIGDDLLDAVVITTGPEAYRRSDGIGVVPAALLGP